MGLMFLSKGYTYRLDEGIICWKDAVVAVHGVSDQVGNHLAVGEIIKRADPSAEVRPDGPSNPRLEFLPGAAQVLIHVSTHSLPNTT